MKTKILLRTPDGLPVVSVDHLPAYAGCGMGWVEFSKGETIAMGYSRDIHGVDKQDSLGFCRFEAPQAFYCIHNKMRIAADFSCRAATLYAEPPVAKDDPERLVNPPNHGHYGEDYEHSPLRLVAWQKARIEYDEWLDSEAKRRYREAVAKREATK